MCDASSFQVFLLVVCVSSLLLTCCRDPGLVGTDHGPGYSTGTDTAHWSQVSPLHSTVSGLVITANTHQHSKLTWVELVAMMSCSGLVKKTSSEYIIITDWLLRSQIVSNSIVQFHCIRLPTILYISHSCPVSCDGWYYWTNNSSGSSEKIEEENINWQMQLHPPAIFSWWVNKTNNWSFRKIFKSPSFDASLHNTYVRNEIQNRDRRIKEQEIKQIDKELEKIEKVLKRPKPQPFSWILLIQDLVLIAIIIFTLPTLFMTWFCWNHYHYLREIL